MATSNNIQASAVLCCTWAFFSELAGLSSASASGFGRNSYVGGVNSTWKGLPVCDILKVWSKSGWVKLVESDVLRFLVLLLCGFRPPTNRNENRNVPPSHGRRDEVPSLQLPTWLGLGFLTAYTVGYLRLILAGRDDSSFLIACHQGSSPSLEEDEAKGSAKQSQLAAAELCHSTSEDVQSDPRQM
jgi:hypothetical protein